MRQIPFLLAAPMDFSGFSWAVGVIEGEAYIRGTLRQGRPRFYLVVDSIDRDTLARLQQVLGGRITGPYKRAKPRRPYWKWFVTDRAGVLYIVRLIRPYVSKRLKQRISELLALDRCHPQKRIRIGRPKIVSDMRFDLFSWAIGLLEGEGSMGITFDTSSKPTGKFKYCRLKVQAAMTDLEPLKRLQKILGGNLSGPYAGKSGGREYWKWSIVSRQAAVALCHILGPYMSKRRKGQIAVGIRIANKHPMVGKHKDKQGRFCKAAA